MLLDNTPKTGLSFKLPHLAEILERQPDIGFFEVHAENYMESGGRPHDALRRICDRYPLSLHGVGLSLGTGFPLDEEHLQRLAKLSHAYRPILVSEHLAWSRYGGSYLNDLLPIPYNATTLARLREAVDHVQEVLDRPLLLENPSTYLAPPGADMTEGAFFAELTRSTGCRILLDVNNVFVSAWNLGFDPASYFADFPFAAVGQIHLAGHREIAARNGQTMLIDTHDGPVDRAVLDLYGQVLTQTGPVPTLLEWDQNLPAFETFLEAAAQIDARSPSAMAA